MLLLLLLVFAPLTTWKTTKTEHAVIAGTQNSHHYISNGDNLQTGQAIQGTLWGPSFLCLCGDPWPLQLAHYGKTESGNNGQRRSALVRTCHLWSQLSLHACPFQIIGQRGGGGGGLERSAKTGILQHIMTELEKASLFWFLKEQAMAIKYRYRQSFFYGRKCLVPLTSRKGSIFATAHCPWHYVALSSTSPNPRLTRQTFNRLKAKDTEKLSRWRLMCPSSPHKDT